MFRFMKTYAKKFSADKSGSVAIETSIILPLILIPLTLATVDVGIAVNSGQSLTSASRSGSQYLINGGQDETELKGAIVNSYNGTLSRDKISIATSCACPNDNALPTGDGQNGGENDGTAQPQQDAYSLRNVTLATIDQCSQSCSDASNERVLVNLTIAHESKGLYKDYPLRKEVSVRVK